MEEDWLCWDEAYFHMLVPPTSVCLWLRSQSIMGEVQQTVPGAGRGAQVVSYGFNGDCRPGPVLSSTRGMRQLKGPPPHRHHKKSLVGWALRPHGGMVKDLLTAGRQEDAMETEEAAAGPRVRREGWPTSKVQRSPKSLP